MPMPQYQFGGFMMKALFPFSIAFSSSALSSGNTNVLAWKLKWWGHSSIIFLYPSQRLSFLPMEKSPGNWLIFTWALNYVRDCCRFDIVQKSISMCPTSAFRFWNAISSFSFSVTGKLSQITPDTWSSFLLTWCYKLEFFKRPLHYVNRLLKCSWWPHLANFQSRFCNTVQHDGDSIARGIPGHLLQFLT